MKSLAHAFTPELSVSETTCTQLPKRMHCAGFFDLFRMEAFPLLHRTEQSCPAPLDQGSAHNSWDNCSEASLAVRKSLNGALKSVAAKGARAAAIHR